MRKKHGTVWTAVRPSGSVNRDRFGRFGLFQPLNDVVQLLFFFSLNGIVLKWLQHIFFPLLYDVVRPSLKITLLKPFLISQPSLVSAFLKNHSQILTLSSLNLSVVPLHCHSSATLPRVVALRSSVSSSLSRRTSQLSLSPASPSQCSLDRSSLVAVAAQPRYFIYGITNTKDSELQ